MNDAERQLHNAHQRHYYETALDKPAMQVLDTPYVRRHVDRMIEHGGLQPGQHILEVGAGLGKFSLPLLQRGLDLTCNDLSPVMLERLRESAPRPVPTVACDIIDIGAHAKEKFDRAIGFFTLHHMVELDAVFAGIRSVLKPGAEICFSEPFGRNPLYLVQIALTPRMTLKAERGIFDMSDKVIHAAMRRAGLEPLPSASYGFAPPFVVNRGWGGRLEDALNGPRWLSFAHAFVMFRARNPG
ncbi:class I SAM-dependent methyltransferase [Arenimonas oryziterrae]|uniref:Methyltransferase type 11 domain-containing protein n=1 Tax=Arenimonas oryziterrae DSM 21050 = YC6267 TaxID=1121015 RepID=A0A091BJX9_9GAMM|nr:class I SAM-dependent methyltransferase [Arenimonas oryziterrae]KFN44635.1 hypothetical protein N789_01095 [Arenimonas oryziterrae DSM 21050 = YC6267]